MGSIYGTAMPMQRRMEMGILSQVGRLAGLPSSHLGLNTVLGRDETIADVLLEHPSCSKQHAVLQFRLVEVPPHPERPLETRRVVKPYVMDLESTNGSRLNGTALEGARYVELRASDMLQFGHSTREYVLVNASDVEANKAPA